MTHTERNIPNHLSWIMDGQMKITPGLTQKTAPHSLPSRGTAITPVIFTEITGKHNFIKQETSFTLIGRHKTKFILSFLPDTI